MMNMLKLLRSGFIALTLCLATGAAMAQSGGSIPDGDTLSDAPAGLPDVHHHHRSDSKEAIVTVGSDAHLPDGHHADSVVAIFGSAISEGEAGDVVSVLGSTRVTGPASGDAVAILGSNYINGVVEGDAVAVLGDMELGPDAEIGGDVVTVGGQLKRDPHAVVHGQAQSVFVSVLNPHFEWLRNWARHCLIYGRPLAFAAGLEWAWALALSLLALYVLLGLLFPRMIVRCTETLEKQPGHSILAAFVGLLLIPLTIGVLLITVIGITVIPFLILGVLAISLVGKAVMLAWLGRRCLAWRPADASGPPALMVLLGGVIVLLIYVVPVIGLLMYKLMGFVGFGVVILALLQSIRSPRIDTAGVTAPGGTLGEAGRSPAATAPAAPQEATPVVNMSTLPRAGFWVRMAALMIDIVLFGVLLSILDHHLANLGVVGLTIYGAIMWKVRGATVGDIVLDVQVLRQDGRPMDWGTAIVRALGCLLSFVAAGLGFLWIVFDREKLAWHDKIAGTIVVRTSKRVTLV